jgi:hypothetical protein
VQATKGSGMRIVKIETGDLVRALATLGLATSLMLLANELAHSAPAPGPDPTDDPVHAAAELARHPATVDAVPDINGPGACVSTAGNVWIKTTNIGIMGNPFTANSSDPSGQWPGPSGVQYMGFWNLWVAAKNPEAPDFSTLRRVSHGFEWRPPSLAPEDRIYSAFEGQPNGVRDFDDDADHRVDEEFLNGKDDDGDGLIDEDFAAVSQQMCTLEIRDDTEQAVNAAFAEKHVPFGLLVRETTYAFAVPGANDFVGKAYEIYNQSGHTLDSVFVGFFVDPDIGPAADDRFFADDLADPRVPQGDYVETVQPNDARYDAERCTQDTIHVNGFTYVDDDGDMNKTTGAGSFLLLGHTTDPTGIKAPRRVGFRMYRTYTPGTPFQQGGQPIVDLERFQTLAATFGIDPVTGFINEERSDAATKTDFRSICSVGPFLDWQNGARIDVEVALAVQRCDYSRVIDDPHDPSQPNPERYAAIVRNAIETQKTFRGGPVQPRSDEATPNMIGRETGLVAAPGTSYELADCRDPEGTSRTVTDDATTWFDLDCNFCTGTVGLGQRRWLAAAPPPAPRTRFTPGNQEITLEWDNRSEYTADPSSGLLDFKSYRIWKASNFTRPVGTSGPGDELWSLLAEFEVYDQSRPLVDSVDTNADGVKDAITHVFPVLLNAQNQERIYPEDVPPLMDPATGDTIVTIGDRPYRDDRGAPQIDRGIRVPHYPIGRYRYVDHNVLNGFVYFYSIAGKDSSGQRDVNGGRGTLAEQEGRRAATESDGVVPQALQGTKANQVYVVPNPYRGRAQWDLNPSAADPTGTHVDFFNMPPGAWTLRIFTVNGDLVQTLRNTDLLVNGKPQQETRADGQATWNLITRNGQDVVSGIYLFSVQSDLGTSQGRFVLIR